MISAGDGTPDRHAAVGFRGFMLARRRFVRDPARVAADGRDGGQLVRAGARGHACPAARRGRYRAKAERRTGNGEGPRGRIAPACQPGPLSSHQNRVRGSAPGMTRAARRTARAARP